MTAYKGKGAAALSVDQNRYRPLQEAIRQSIQRSIRIGRARDGQACRCITFRDYMSLCLYHPDYGYYRSGTSRVGREGDFYTSAYIGDIMGELLAERLMQIAWELFPDGCSVEAVDWGGGTGRLGRQMLQTWQRLGEAGRRFSLTVVDGNPEHRRQAGELLGQQVAEGKARVISSEQAEAEDWQGRPCIVVANELLDAFPVHRVVQEAGRLWEWGVHWEEEEGALKSCLMEPGDARLTEWLDRQQVRLAEGQTTEIGLEAAEWTASLACKLGKAVLVLIDYGDSTAELTGSHRMDGTLLCYEGHRAHNDPYRNPGEQDLTAHVDFDLIRYLASAAGWREKEYGTQKKFLVDAGVLTKLSEHDISDPFHPVVRRNRAIRQLLLSDGMSELFKVQIWVKQA
jgi:SAM-dependent MidA family methyltransferase